MFENSQEILNLIPEIPTNKPRLEAYFVCAMAFIKDSIDKGDNECKFILGTKPFVEEDKNKMAESILLYKYLLESKGYKVTLVFPIVTVSW